MAEYPLVDNTIFEADEEYIPQPEPEPQAPAWMDGSLRIGIHTSIAGSYLNALESARKLGANALQIFSASPRMWQVAKVGIPTSDAKAFRTRREELALGPLVIHANYLVNLAATQPMLRTRSIQAFHEELVRGVLLGADYVVVHPGTRGDASIDSAIASIVDAIKQAAKRVPLGDMRILIENTAGMGSSVGSRLEEVGAIVHDLNRAGGSDRTDDRPLQVGACLDTAHLLAAGYDIRTEAGLEQTLDAVDRTIGLQNVPVPVSIATHTSAKAKSAAKLLRASCVIRVWARFLPRDSPVAPSCWRRRLTIPAMTVATSPSCGNWRE
jgi:deoxyribonuclease IV